MFSRIDRISDLHSEAGPLHLALGVFDGVHAGHQAVIQSAVRAASEKGGRAFVVTFSPHPIEVVAPQKAPKALLSSLVEKLRLFEKSGANGALVVHFDLQFSQIEAADFIQELTKNGVASISVGEDWRFGKARGGDVTLLHEIGNQRGFQVFQIPPVKSNGTRISSTKIRTAILEGEMEVAEQMLGRPYTISGEVIEGLKNGRKIGYPTANIAIDGLQCPKSGVWIVRISEGQFGIANLGTRPTVEGQSKNLEVHLLNFTGDLYGKELNVEFCYYLRGEQRFDSLEKLKAQITLDEEKAKRWLTEQ